jgi:hypothetical protein
MTDDDLWAAIGAAVRKQGRCIRIFDAVQHDGTRVPMVTTPLRPRKKARAAHWIAYVKMRDAS